MASTAHAHALAKTQTLCREIQELIHGFEHKQPLTSMQAN